MKRAVTTEASIIEAHRFDLVRFTHDTRNHKGTHAAPITHAVKMHKTSNCIL
eukprot:m.1659259 g.1659259  ORF g.1659259 m.1659259 type:complete len:52 (-) comp118507_c0_seq1:111-266(-)